MESTENMLDQAAKAPGCFASPSVFAMDSKVCGCCIATNECRTASSETLERIRGVINVSDLLKRHEKARLVATNTSETPYKPEEPETLPTTDNQTLAPVIVTPAPIIPKVVKRKTPTEIVVFYVTGDQETTIQALPKKTGELARQQIKQNLISKIKPALKMGLNSYAETGPKFLRLACDMLLEGGFTRAGLNKRMVKDFGWGTNTSGPHVAQIVGMFVAFDIVQEIGGQFVAKSDAD